MCRSIMCCDVEASKIPKGSVDRVELAGFDMTVLAVQALVFADNSERTLSTTFALKDE